VTGPLTRARAAAIADVVVARWVDATLEHPTDISIDVLGRQIIDALKWERERRLCELRVELLRARMLRFFGEL
jgi:hypothetical protein